MTIIDDDGHLQFHSVDVTVDRVDHQDNAAKIRVELKRDGEKLCQTDRWYKIGDTLHVGPFKIAPKYE